MAFCASLSACGNGSLAPATAVSFSLSKIFPNAVPAGALAFTLTVNGSNFSSGATVEWNGSSRTTNFVSSTEIQAQIPATDLVTPGKATVTVTNSGGAASAGMTFTIAKDTIAFQSTRALDGSDAGDGGVFNVWVVNPDGSGAAAMTHLTATGSEALEPAWSRDGSKVAFTSEGALDGSDAANTNSTPNIWVVNSDGTGATPLTKLTSSNSGSFSPAWSPDGTKIAFSSERALDGSDARNTNGGINLWIMNADGSSPTPLTKITASEIAVPVWSPDGSKIAFASDRAVDGSDAINNTNNVWVINADGTGLTALTKLTAAGSGVNTVVWSPDGTKISFDSERALDGSNTATATENIWLMNADGSNQQPLTRVQGAEPSWSPDGSKIAFVSVAAFDGSNAPNAGSTANIWVMNADGSSAIPLIMNTAGGSSSDAIWAPGGSKIIFDSTRAFDGSNSSNTALDIWIMNADGSSAVPLTQITAANVRSLTPTQP